MAPALRADSRQMSFIVVLWKPSREKQWEAASMICSLRASVWASVTLGMVFPRKRMFILFIRLSGHAFCDRGHTSAGKSDSENHSPIARRLGASHCENGWAKE